jgi:hypothetical protein
MPLANLTGAATFAGAEAGALANVLNRNTIAERWRITLSVTSATFTVTNTKVIDAVLLWIRQGAAGSTGTFKVDLQKGGVSQASVTVNRADLPAFITGQTIGNMVPVLFKLSSTATGDGGSELDHRPDQQQRHERRQLRSGDGSYHQLHARASDHDGGDGCGSRRPVLHRRADWRRYAQQPGRDDELRRQRLPTAMVRGQLDHRRRRWNPRRLLWIADLRDDGRRPIMCCASTAI